MPKDRDQLTPDESEDRNKLRPHRSADREATEPVDSSTGRGPASHGSDPPAHEQVGAPESEHYR